MDANVPDTDHSINTVLHGVRHTACVHSRELTSKHRFRAYIDASRNGLVRYQLPLVGAIANQWLEEE